MRKILTFLVLASFLITFKSSIAWVAQGEEIDDFNGRTNLLGGNSNVYQRAPSRAMHRKVEDEINGKQEKVLCLKYDKKSTGGPYEKGGWCGYYTLLGPAGDTFDASNYTKISMWVKGETGKENFVIGMADSYWQEVGDSLKSEEIGKYLPGGKITTKWQKAEIPLEVYFVDLSDLASMAICFEGELFGGEDAQGMVYIDKIAFEF